MSKEKAQSRVERLLDDIHHRWGFRYNEYRRSEERFGREPLPYARWIGTLSKNTQIRHQEQQRRLDQAAHLLGYTTDWMDQVREQRHFGAPLVNRVKPLS